MPRPTPQPTPPPPPRRRWPLVAVLVIVLVSGGVAATTLGRHWLVRQWAAQAAAELRSPDAAERAAAAQRLRLLGLAGVDPLVEALTDENSAAAVAAERAIDQSLADWRHIDGREASRRLERLAQALAANIELIPPERRYAPARWTQLMLVWPLDSETVNVPQLVADCHRIAGRASLQRIDTELQAQLAAVETPPVVAPTGPLVAENAAEPAGEEPSDIAPRSDEPMLLAPPRQNLAAVLPPTTVEPMPDPEDAPLAPSDRALTQSTAEPPRFIAPRANPLPVPRPARSARPAPERRPAQTGRTSFAWLRDETDIAVMRFLHADETSLVEAARDELQRRGYRPRDLTLCRTLVHPDPDQRRIFAEALPRIAGIDARPWLLQLAEDRDPEVRRTATNILRTTQDPKVLQQVR